MRVLKFGGYGAVHGKQSDQLSAPYQPQLVNYVVKVKVNLYVVKVKGLNTNLKRFWIIEINQTVFGTFITKIFRCSYLKEENSVKD